MADELKHKVVGTELTQAEWEATDKHIFNSQATGDILYASSSTQLKRLAVGSTGGIIYITGGIPAYLAIGTTNKILKVSGGVPAWESEGAGTSLDTSRKTADETVNNSDTLQNDDHLNLTVAVNEVWDVFLWLRLISASATPDHKIAFTVPTNATFTWFASYYIGQLVSGALLTAETTGSITTATGTSVLELLIWGLYEGGDTAGTLQMQWAQNTATSEDTKILKNSYMTCHQLT